MSRKFLTHVNFAKNEIQNAVVQNLAAAPAAPIPGQIYYDTATGRFSYFGAAAWIDPTARVNHTGTQLASTISNFDTQVRTSTIAQLAAPTTSVSFNSQLITNVLAPVSATDAANKGYVDSLANGTDWKVSVRAATTVNIALTALQTIDGISVAAGERVLVKTQTAGAENGIYLASTGAWTRAPDADAAVEVTAGLATMVTEGTTQADTQWVLATNDPITLGTTALVFAQIGAGSSYSGGNGIVIAGNVISVDQIVVTRKFSATLGAGTSIAVNHNLNTLDVQVQIYEIADGATVECDVLRTTVNQITLGFPVAIIASAFRVVVQG